QYIPAALRLRVSPWEFWLPLFAARCACYQKIRSFSASKGLFILHFIAIDLFFILTRMRTFGAADY
ncbi:hypothetical protein, partial [Niabella drilacis]|uniref:hypothetical protein n=1 Tax=Niabella drilacis (strain DSM 25811 / CCM 8410 / CCUG 62505 / LMG 26954 / E90) TaxID=1285928 RepID=UPI001C40B29F